MITVIAHYRVAPSDVDFVAGLLRTHAVWSEAEPGCRLFRVYQEEGEPSHFALIEVYDDRESFVGHRATEHFRTNIEGTLVPLLMSREWRVYEPLRG